MRCSQARDAATIRDLGYRLQVQTNRVHELEVGGD
jgi:hypothetical protein